jgi:hypothetical protein
MELLHVGSCQASLESDWGAHLNSSTTLSCNQHGFRVQHQGGISTSPHLVQVAASPCAQVMDPAGNGMQLQHPVYTAQPSSASNSAGNLPYPQAYACSMVNSSAATATGSCSQPLAPVATAAAESVTLEDLQLQLQCMLLQQQQQKQLTQEQQAPVNLKLFNMQQQPQQQQQHTQSYQQLNFAQQPISSIYVNSMCSDTAQLQRADQQQQQQPVAHAYMVAASAAPALAVTASGTFNSNASSGYYVLTTQNSPASTATSVLLPPPLPSPPQQQQQQQLQLFDGTSGGAACSFGFEGEEPLLRSSGSVTSACSAFGSASAVVEPTLATFLQAQQQQQQQGVAATVPAAAVQLLPNSSNSGMQQGMAALHSQNAMGSSSSSGGSSAVALRPRCSSSSTGTCVCFPGHMEVRAKADNSCGNETIPFSIMPAGNHGFSTGLSVVQIFPGSLAPPPGLNPPGLTGVAAAAGSAAVAALAVYESASLSVPHQVQQQQQLASASASNRQSMEQQSGAFGRMSSNACRHSTEQLGRRSSSGGSSRPITAVRSSLEQPHCRSSSSFSRVGTPRLGISAPFSRPNPPAAARGDTARSPAVVVFAPAPPTAAAAAAALADAAVECGALQWAPRDAPGWASRDWDPKAQVQQAIQTGSKKGTGVFIPACVLLDDV